MKKFIVKKKNQSKTQNNSPGSPSSPARDLFENLSPWNDSDQEEKFSRMKEFKENLPPKTIKSKKFKKVESFLPKKPPLHPKSIRFNSNTNSPNRSKNNSVAS
jgi:hypothetical protein